MKKRGIFLLILLVTAMLCGCGTKTVFAVEEEGYTLSVDTTQHTVTHGTDVYRYEKESPSIIENTITVRYPNGASYTKKTEYGIVIGSPGNTTGSDSALSTKDDGTYSGTVDENRYVPGRVLVNAVKRAISMKEDQQEKREENGKCWVIAILALAVGFVNLRFPEGMWHFQHWWCVDGGEPSQFYLARCRFGGVVLLIIGAIFLLCAIF